MVLRGAQFTIAVDVLLELLGIRQLVQSRADDGLRFCVLGYDHALDPVLLADPSVATDEVHGTRTEEIGLRQPSIVVVLGRGMAVDTRLGLFRTHGVREVRVEALRRHAVRRDRELLRVRRLSHSVLRRNHDGRRRPDGRESIAFHVALHAQHEHVVARDLRVVRRVIAALAALEVAHFAAHGRVLRQVTAEARSDPRRVTRVAFHLLRAVRELALAVRGWDLLRRSRSLVVTRVSGIDGVRDLLHEPLDVGVEHRALNDLLATQHRSFFEAFLAGSRAPRRGIALRCRSAGRDGSRRGDLGSLLHRAVAILTRDFDGPLDLGIDGAVTVRILREVTIDAVHPALGVDVHQVHGLARLRRECGLRIGGHLAEFGQDAFELLRIVVVDDVAVGVEQVALAIRLEHGPEDPTVTVIVRELRVLQVLVQVGDVREEIAIPPLAALGRALGVAVDTLEPLVIR